MSLVPRPDPDARERRLAWALFGLTAVSVFLVRWTQWDAVGSGWLDALVFTAVLLAILGSHEVGHYLTARAYGFRLSPPLFLPVPLWVGTLGAVIDVREYPRSRGALLAMGAAGPLAGFAVMVLFAGVAVRRGLVPRVPDESFELSTPLLFYVVGLFDAQAVALSTRDPVAFAVWIGALVTAINLLPFGQLDGGHLLAALWPEHTSAVSWGVTALLLGLALWWPWWLGWLFALHLLGARKPMTVRGPRQAPGPRERWLAVACGVVFLLCFTPVPLR